MPGADDRPLWQRLGWMAAICVGSVFMLGAVTGFFRWWLLG